MSAVASATARAGDIAWERDRLAATLSVLRHDEQDQVAANELPTDGFTDVSVDVSYRFELPAGRLLAFVRGTNLLDEEARRSTSPLKEFAPLPGVNIAAGLRMGF
jgi:iron complex outermembrane receptor protein